MTAAVPFDFVAVRASRDSALMIGRAQAQRLVGSIIRSIDRWAERTEALSTPLLSIDAEAARALNAWGARRLRAECRRTLVDIPIEARADLVATAEAAFASALLTLADRRAAGEVAK